jgi:hypothetical protein
MLAYGVADNLFDEYLRMRDTTCLNLARPHAWTRCTSYAKPWMRCYAMFTWESQMLLTLLGCCLSMRQGDFWGWLKEFIACTRSEKTIIFLGRGNILGMRRDALSFLRLLLHIIYKFGTNCSVWQVPTMPSTSSSAPMYSLGLRKATHQW